MDGYSPSEIAAIQRKFRRFNSTGGSTDFTPPQNTPPQNTPVLRQPIPRRPKTKKSVQTRISEIIISDHISEQLLSYQIPHVQNLMYAIEHNVVALDASDTGTGKTYSAVATAKALNLDMIVICPKPVIPNWYKVGSTLGVNMLAVVNYETIRNGKYYPTYTDFTNEEREECPYIEQIRETIVDDMTQEPILTANGQPKTKIVKIRWHFPNNCLVLFDEAHKGKNGLCSSIPTINSRIMVSIKPYLTSERRVFGLFLSATITDKLTNFDVIAYMLGLYKRYNKKTYKLFLRKLSSNARSQLEAIHEKIFPRLGSRMDIREIKKTTGDTIFRRNDIKARAYEIDNETAALIEQQHLLIKQAMIALQTKQMHDGDHPLVAILRARQRIELLKVPIFVRLSRHYLMQGKAVIIFVCFKETMDLIAQKITQAGVVDMEGLDYICGGQNAEERDAIINSFQNDEFHLLICNIAAGGVGISLHDKHGNYQRVTLISPTWSAIEIKQAQGRGYRADAMTDCIQRIVYARSESVFGDDADPGIEEYMCELMATKLENISMLNDGDLRNYEDFTKSHEQIDETDLLPFQVDE